MQEHSAGDTLSITVAREGQMQTVSLTLGEKNASNSGNSTNGASRQEKSAESAPQQDPQLKVKTSPRSSFLLVGRLVA